MYVNNGAGVVMPNSFKPKLALVLGSGGVRSIAALGVVDVLWREGIAPDLIVGCSAGAIFGALISLGHSATEAVSIATTLWTAEVTKEHRWRAIPQMLWPRLSKFDADFSLRNDRLIRNRLERAFGDARLEELTLPLRVTATDAASGDAIVINKGRIVDALRASIAMPFMFAPHYIDGQRVVDGFISDPLPVSAAQDAKAVLALGFDAPMPQRVNGPSRLLAQVTSSMTNNLMRARLAAVESAGMRLLRIEPTLERRIGLFDTAAMPYLVEQGRQATEAVLPSIFKLLEQQRPHLVAA
ncbi:MAG: patatin-like phospholipase family protein [Burkholderiaceae bacterium]